MMKSLKYLLYVGLPFLPLYSNSLEDELLLQQVTDLKNKVFAQKKAIDIVYQKMSETCSMPNHSVIVLGDTGVGKSTFLHWIGKKKLNSISKVNARGKPLGVYDLALNSEIDEIPGISIGRGVNSETKCSSFYIDNNNVVYWDFPGFMDTEGPLKELLNDYSLRYLFKKIRGGMFTEPKIKVVLIMPEFFLSGSDRCQRALSSLDKVSKMFKGHNFYENLYIVISKSTKKFESNDEIADYLFSALCLEKNCKRVSALDINKFNYAKMKEKILLFPSPNESGEYTHSQYLKAAINLLSSKQPSNSIISPSNDSKLFFGRMFKHFYLYEFSMEKAKSEDYNQKYRNLFSDFTKYSIRIIFSGNFAKEITSVEQIQATVQEKNQIGDILDTLITNINPIYKIFRLHSYNNQLSKLYSLYEVFYDISQFISFDFSINEKEFKLNILSVLEKEKLRRLKIKQEQELEKNREENRILKQRLQEQQRGCVIL